MATVFAVVAPFDSSVFAVAVLDSASVAYAGEGSSGHGCLSLHKNSARCLGRCALWVGYEKTAHDRRLISYRTRTLPDQERIFRPYLGLDLATRLSTCGTLCSEGSISIGQLCTRSARFPRSQRSRWGNPRHMTILGLASRSPHTHEPKPCHGRKTVSYAFRRSLADPCACAQNVFRVRLLAGYRTSGSGIGVAGNIRERVALLRIPQRSTSFSLG